LTRSRASVYRLVFSAAAVYNIAFGLWAALFPLAFFRVFALEPPRYPAIWACLGMVVGLYGVAYAYAAWRLDRAAPLIAIGLAGKVFGPIGWLLSVSNGELPARTFPLIVFDDLIWWLPFSLFLLERTRVREFFARTAPWWCVALHIAGGLGTLFFLRGGSEAIADLQQRAQWLDAHPAQWRAGWLIWMAAAVSLTGFYAWWGARVASRPALVALSVASLGLACDFAGESIFIGWLPHPGTPLHRAASLLTGGAGNALYTIAGILLTLVTPAMPPLLRAWAWLAWTSGIALSLMTIAGNDSGVVVASAALMVLFIPWVAMAGVRLR
jgi:small multidrug resistance pump